jgi:hypothetical protein
MADHGSQHHIEPVEVNNISLCNPGCGEVRIVPFSSDKSGIPMYVSLPLMEKEKRKAYPTGATGAGSV